MVKQRRFTLRLEKNDFEVWELYAISIGYESVSEFIRDSINGLIKAKQKPSREVIIVGE